MCKWLPGTCALLGVFALSGVTALDASGADQMTPPATLQPAMPRPKPVLVPRPDLTVESLHPELGPLAYCVKEGGKWYARATARNKGTAEVPPGITMIRSKVEFSNGQTMTLNGPTKFVPPYYVEWQVPAACFQADCSFKIWIDYDDQVKESNEGNNIALGRCPPG